MVKKGRKVEEVHLARRLAYGRYGLLILIVILVVAGLVYYLYKTTPPVCEDKECFFAKLSVCEPSKFVFYGNITFDYIIQGKEGDYCNVNVKLVRSYWRGSTFDTLNGKTMVCQVKYGQALFPEEDLNSCHGQLKESLQEMILQRLHGYILDNLAT
ncbi:hypothetical protein KA107_00320 [Candidatus Pacearchaeota archaeon]|nr:hypothetical protein [Candidatus Pacearchaeota archaeon]